MNELAIFIENLGTIITGIGILVAVVFFAACFGYIWWVDRRAQKRGRQ